MLVLLTSFIFILYVFFSSLSPANVSKIDNHNSSKKKKKKIPRSAEHRTTFCSRCMQLLPRSRDSGDDCMRWPYSLRLGPEAGVPMAGSGRSNRRQHMNVGGGCGPVGGNRKQLFLRLLYNCSQSEFKPVCLLFYSRSGRSSECFQCHGPSTPVLTSERGVDISERPFFLLIIGCVYDIFMNIICGVWKFGK